MDHQKKVFAKENGKRKRTTEAREIKDTGGPAKTGFKGEIFGMAGSFKLKGGLKKKRTHVGRGEVR